VNAAKTANVAVTNAKINVNVAGALPYRNFMGTTESMTGAYATPHYIAIKGFNQTPDSTMLNYPNYSILNPALGCTTAHLRVALSAAPGAGKNRSFRLYNGAGNAVGTALIDFSGTATEGQAIYSNIPANAQLALGTETSAMAPDDAKATITFTCQ
jgi:hypothetical protein